MNFYKGNDFTSLGALALGDDADNVRVDFHNGHVVIGYGEGGLAIVDSETRARVQDIKLPGHPESFQIDPQSNRAYVNVPDAGQIVSARDASRPNRSHVDPVARREGGGILQVAQPRD